MELWQLWSGNPSALGCLLLLAALVSLPTRLSWGRLLISALLAVACLFTKPYFFAIFGVGVVILAIRDIRLCAIYVGMVVTLLTIVTVAVVNVFYPAFFVYNLLHHLHMGLDSTRATCSSSSLTSAPKRGRWLSVSSLLYGLQGEISYTTGTSSPL